uniref:Uncharacterized protein n=1 Tax=Tanacetum cinerariifolium TaxID=118510 RepID=A0A699H984_TANCI|nr:hypothetical protein [Tanacetum cinerariifolium]
MSSGVIGKRVRVMFIEEVGDLSLEAMEDEEVSMVDGFFDGAFGELGLEVEALVDAMEVRIAEAKKKRVKKQKETAKLVSSNYRVIGKT